MEFTIVTMKELGLLGEPILKKIDTSNEVSNYIPELFNNGRAFLLPQPIVVTSYQLEMNQANVDMLRVTSSDPSAFPNIGFIRNGRLLVEPLKFPLIITGVWLWSTTVDNPYLADLRVILHGYDTNTTIKGFL